MTKVADDYIRSPAKNLMWFRAKTAFRLAHTGTDRRRYGRCFLLARNMEDGLRLITTEPKEVSSCL